MKQKLLVTGATGFLGSHFNRRINKDIYESYLFGKHESLKDNIQKMDLRIFSAVEEKVSKIRPEIIVHLGGIVNLARDFEVAKACIEANISGTLNLLESLRLVKPKLLIYVSTEEVYGKAKLPYKEDSPVYPPSPYAMTKFAGENLCTMYGAYLDFSVIILRVGTMYGPGDNLRRFIPSIVADALTGHNIALNSGKKARDYVYVEDVVDALVEGLEKPEIKGTEVINIGGGRAYTLEYLVEEVVDLCGSNSKIRLGMLPDRIFESDIWKMDISKAEKLLHWTPRTTLTEGLRHIIDFYKNK